MTIKKNIEGAAVVKISKQSIKHKISPQVSVLRGQDGCLKAEFHEELKFQGFILYFSVKIEQTSKNHPKMVFWSSILGIFEVCLILVEK